MFHAFLLSGGVFWGVLKLTFLKNSFRIPSECQTDWIKIRPDILSNLIKSDILSSLIWVETVCKGYQQTTLRNIELSEQDKKRPAHEVMVCITYE